MSKKTFRAELTILAMVSILVGMLLIGVAKANPISYPAPIITIFSPSQGGTSEAPVVLSLKIEMYAYDYRGGQEIINWLNYSLDGQLPVPINVTYQPRAYSPGIPAHNASANCMLNLSEGGFHNLTIQGRTAFMDPSGKIDYNFGETIYKFVSFTTLDITAPSPTPSPTPSTAPSPTQQPTPEPSPTPTANIYSDWIPYAIIAVVVVGMGATAVYLKKRKRAA